MKTRLLAMFVLLLAALAGPTSPAASAADTLMLDLALGDDIAVDADVTISQATVQNGVLVLTGSVAGTVTALGRSATLKTQPVTVTADTACKAGTGTLTLTTTQLKASLSDGTTLTVDPATVTVSASCGKTPTLTVTASALSAALSDGTKIRTSSCSVSLSSPSSTTLGGTVCDLKDLICTLDSTVDAQLLSQAIAELQQVLDQVNSTLG